MSAKSSSYRWRRVLGASAVSIAVLLIVSRSYRLWMETSSRAPGFYDHCCRDLEMLETKIFNSLNLPAVVLTAPARWWWDRPLYTGLGWGITTGDVENLIGIGLFWWWIGKQCDQKWRATDILDRIVYHSLAILGVLMVVAGFAILVRKEFLEAPEIFISFLAWGFLLSCYFIHRIGSFRSLPAA
jgi:hypothetical protein